MNRGPLLLLIPALAFGLASCASAPRQKPAEEAEALPDFKAKDHNGKEWSLASSDSKPLVIDFWATWCVPCLKSIPDLKAFRDKHKGKVTLIGAATDQKGWEVVKPVIQRFAIDYPIILASEDTASAYGVEGYPYLVLLYKGKMEKRMLGRHSTEDLEKELAAWLK